MSWQMHVVAARTQLFRRPVTYQTRWSARHYLRQPKDNQQPPGELRGLRQHRVTTAPFDGFINVTVEPVAPQKAKPRGTIVYLHGGGYVSQPQATHWQLVADLVSATGRPVCMPLYGLAPDHDAAQANQFLDALITRAQDRGPVYVAGDSAGGGLALAAAQRWTDTVCGATLISPWLDIALRNPDIKHVARHDPWLHPVGLRYIGHRWANGLSADDPTVSPLCGDLHHLPPVDLYVGTRDLFMPDCRKLVAQMRLKSITYTEQPGAIHIYPLLAVPEARAARQQIILTIGHVLNCAG